MPLQRDTVGNFSVRTLVEGSGPALVYFHDLEGHPGEANFLKRLATNRRVFAPETPGYGESTGFEHLEDVLDLTLHHRALVSSWSVGPVDIIGHGLGGMFAAEFAALCPHLTRRLVLVGSYGLWLDDPQIPDAFAMSADALKAAKWASSDAAPAETSIFVPPPDDPHAPVLERTKNLAVATNFLWPIPDRGLARRLQYIDAPTLVIHGAADGLVPPAYAEEFARLIPNANVATIEGAGHIPQLEREDEFLTVINEFLSGGST
jgi:pimeloyl-ACP methyl ester carboxylesterase